MQSLTHGGANIQQTKSLSLKPQKWLTFLKQNLIISSLLLIKVFIQACSPYRVSMVVRSNFTSMKSLGLAIMMFRQCKGRCCLTPNYKVDVIPVRQQKLLKGSHNICQPALANKGKRFLGPCWFEVPVEHLSLLHPLGSQDLVLSGVVGIFLGQETVSVLLIFAQEGVFKF